MKGSQGAQVLPVSPAQFTIARYGIRSNDSQAMMDNQNVAYKHTFRGKKEIGEGGEWGDRVEVTATLLSLCIVMCVHFI